MIYSRELVQMALSDLWWLSEIFNDTKHARSLCDSWASCFWISRYSTAIIHTHTCLLMARSHQRRVAAAGIPLLRLRYQWAVNRTCAAEETAVTEVRSMDANWRLQETLAATYRWAARLRRRASRGVCVTQAAFFSLPYSVLVVRRRPWPGNGNTPRRQSCDDRSSTYRPEVAELIR